MLKTIAFCLAVVAIILVAAHLIYRPPSLSERTVSQAVEASAETALGRIALSAPPNAGGRSGVIPLVAGPDAFAARIALIRAAEQALDVQYYIWQRDTAGLLLLDELRSAAERGVRVRLLLDDNGISGLDGHLAALDAMANVEVRLFNPFILRSPKMLGYAFDFFRLNRRMHNKSLTADGAMSILGGRNIGDTYFGLGEGIEYIDTDVLVAGEAAGAVGADFDRYWASRSAYPVALILPEPEEDALRRLSADAQADADTAEGKLYLDRMQRPTIVTEIGAGSSAFEWTQVTLVSDDPAKGVNEAEVKDFLFPQLMDLLARPGRSVDLVSAYFVPGQRFADSLARLAQSGTRVRVLTNSQDATDVIVVHSAYVKYRPALLAAGVELFELKPAFATDTEEERSAPGGSSRASLHSKTMAVDGERIFIGSFNFDQRSFGLNTEMGVLIDSNRLATGLAQAFETRFPAASYRPVLNEEGAIVWQETRGDGTIQIHQEEPGNTVFRSVIFSLLGLLPIEWLL